MCTSKQAEKKVEHGRGGSHVNRARQAEERKANERLLGPHPTASVPAKQQIKTTTKKTDADLPPGMVCAQQYF